MSFCKLKVEFGSKLNVFLLQASAVVNLNSSLVGSCQKFRG